MSMVVSFQYPMGMGMGMGVIFENGYGCAYNSTCPEPASLPFLLQNEDGKWIKHQHSLALSHLSSYFIFHKGVEVHNMSIGFCSDTSAWVCIFTIFILLCLISTNCHQGKPVIVPLKLHIQSSGRSPFIRDGTKRFVLNGTERCKCSLCLNIVFFFLVQKEIYEGI